MKAIIKNKLPFIAIPLGANILYWLILQACSLCENILLGIFAILLYRLTLWLSPLWVTVISWISVKKMYTIGQRFAFYTMALALNFMLFLLCFYTSGSWY